MTFLLANWKWFLIAGLVALLGIMQVRVDHAKKETADAQAETANLKTVAAQEAQKAEASARQEEARRDAEKERISDEARTQVAAAQTAARAADASAAGLRQRLAAYVAAVSRATKDSGITQGSAATHDPGRVLAELFSRIDERAGLLASYADQARIAGQACERSYESLQLGNQVP